LGGLGFGGEGDLGPQGPRAEFGGVRYATFVVFCEAGFEVAGHADVALCGVGLALEEVDVVHLGGSEN